MKNILVNSLPGPDILVIRGISPSEISATEVTVEIPQYIRNMCAASYSQVPTTFTTPEEWPIVTNLKCWTCDRVPKSYPRFLPTCPVETGGIVKWTRVGIFDEWNCVISYVRAHLPRDQQWDAEHNVCCVASIFAGKKILRIRPAPEKTLMRQYCGNNGLTEAQYDELLQKINADYDLTVYKLEHYKTRED